MIGAAPYGFVRRFPLGRIDVPQQASPALQVAADTQLQPDAVLGEFVIAADEGYEQGRGDRLRGVRGPGAVGG